MQLGMPGMPSWGQMQAGMVQASSPSPSDIMVGMETMKYGKATVKVKSYDVDVFDMSMPNDRKRFAELMLKLTPMIQAKSAVVWRNDLQVMTRSDKSTYWARYVEWSEYEIPGLRISEEDLQVEKKKEEKKKPVSEEEAEKAEDDAIMKADKAAFASLDDVPDPVDEKELGDVLEEDK